MIKADRYFFSTLKEIINSGTWSKEPRTKWADGTPAHYKSIKQKTYKYNILEGEYPIGTFRRTAVKGAFYDMEAIYIKQTNVIAEMHPSIHPWWLPFVVRAVKLIDGQPELITGTIGQTYGHTVKRYDLMNKLLQGMQHNPESRRHIINLWQEQQMVEDSNALVPCAFMTEWSVDVGGDVNMVDLTLTQRSQDFLMTAWINPIQYVFLGLMVCNHLSFVTRKKHVLRTFEHHIQDVHIYDRHFAAADYLLTSRQQKEQPMVGLICKPKDFYAHTWEDFLITGMEDIQPLPFKLQIAI